MLERRVGSPLVLRCVLSDSEDLVLLVIDDVDWRLSAAEPAKRVEAMTLVEVSPSAVFFLVLLGLTGVAGLEAHMEGGHLFLLGSARRSVVLDLLDLVDHQISRDFLKTALLRS